MANEAESYPDWLRAAEEQLVQKRRATLPGGNSQGTEPPPLVGLALSGGGIRSATFGLGVLQGLAKHDLLTRVDYLSSVSGGGYVGAFLGGLYSRAKERVDGASSTHDAVKRCLLEDTPERFPLRWLRENGRYLSPAGGGVLILVTLLIRNWLAVLMSLFIPAVTIFVVGNLLKCQFVRLIPEPYTTVRSAWFLGGLSAWFALVAGCAYWVVLPKQAGTPFWRPWFTLALAVALSVAGVWALNGSRWFYLLPATLIASGAWAWLAWAVVAPMDNGATTRLEQSARARLHLTKSAQHLIGLTAAILVVTAADKASLSLYGMLVQDPKAFQVGFRWLGAEVLGLGVAGSGPWILQRISRLSTSTRSSGRAGAVLVVVAVVAAGGFLLAAGAAAHALAWKGAPVFDLPPGSSVSFATGFRELARTGSLDATWVGGAALGLVALTAAMSQVRAFLNQSSYTQFYSDRLTRTFLGATNPARWAAADPDAAAAFDRISNDRRATLFDPTEVVRGDGFSMDEYAPHQHGGPLHLINTTLNQTIDPCTGAGVRDRKALPLSVGPVAFSVGLHCHGERKGPGAEPTTTRLGKHAEGTIPPSSGEQRRKEDPTTGAAGGGRFELFEGDDGKDAHAEALSLGQWIGISGAAVASGLGSRTSALTSLLIVLFNLRLGYWWHSGTSPHRSRPGRTHKDGVTGHASSAFARSFPVLAHFVDEMTARFHGTGRRNWYLSDGGHFDNTGVYELVRRKLPLIIFSDAGADVHYRFEDLAGLVRKARIDFGANITFLDEGALKERFPALELPLCGPLQERDAETGTLNDTANRRACSAIASIEYAGGQRGVLLVLKPALTGGEPLDIVHYAAQHESFPNDSTGDQFFDEAQWESYRRLGQHVAGRALAPWKSADGWAPELFEPLVAAEKSGAQMREAG